MDRETEISLIHKGLDECEDVDELFEALEAIVVAKRAKIVHTAEYDLLRQRFDELWNPGSRGFIAMQIFVNSGSNVILVMHKLATKMT